MEDKHRPTASEIQALLSQLNPDPDVGPAAYHLEPLAGHGASGHEIFRLAVDWTILPANGERNYVLKRWTSTSEQSQIYGLTESSEALAHRTGLFDSIPSSIHVPIVASLSEATDGDTWLLMSNVAEELDQYGRPNRFPFEQVQQKVSIVLDRLAEMHISWERSDMLTQAVEQGHYSDCTTHMAVSAAAYRHALRYGATGQVVEGRVINESFVGELLAFLRWLPPEFRPLWEHVLVDRSSLIAAAEALPHTLLHGDLDDRNIGLSIETADEPARLVLIDWEWIVRGPGGLDAAKPIHQFLASMPLEPANLSRYFTLLPVWGEEYLQAYRHHGGKVATDAEVLAGYWLGLVREAMTPFPWVIGRLLVAMEREQQAVNLAPSLETQASMFDAMLDWGEQTVLYVSEYMQSTLGVGP